MSSVCRDCAVPYDVWPGVCPNCGASEPACPPLPPALSPDPVAVRAEHGPESDVVEGSVVEPRVVVDGPAVVVAAGPSETEDAPKPRRVRRRSV